MEGGEGVGYVLAQYSMFVWVILSLCVAKHSDIGAFILKHWGLGEGKQSHKKVKTEHKNWVSAGGGKQDNLAAAKISQ